MSDCDIWGDEWRRNTNFLKFETSNVGHGVFATDETIKFPGVSVDFVPMLRLFRKKSLNNQWRIQDFLDGRAPPPPLQSTNVEQNRLSLKDKSASSQTFMYRFELINFTPQIHCRLWVAAYQTQERFSTV